MLDYDLLFADGMRWRNTHIDVKVLEKAFRQWYDYAPRL